MTLHSFYSFSNLEVQKNIAPHVSPFTSIMEQVFLNLQHLKFPFCFQGYALYPHVIMLEYYSVYHLPSTPVCQLLIGSVHYYCESGEGAERLKSVKYNSRQPCRAPRRHTAHTRTHSRKKVLCQIWCTWCTWTSAQAGTHWVGSHFQTVLFSCDPQRTFGALLGCGLSHTVRRKTNCKSHDPNIMRPKMFKCSITW